MHRNCTTSLSVLLILNTACSGGDASDADAAPALTEGGRAAVTASQVDALPEIDAQPDLRIDGHEAVLTSVEWIGILPDVGQAVLQPGDYRIRFFDATGADAGSFGTRGQGPGEFERPLRAGYVGEQIWVQDPVTHRITFVADGQLGRTEPSPSRIVPATAGSADTTVYSSGFPVAVYPGDTLLLRAFHRGNDTVELLRTTLDGTIVESVTTLGEQAPPSVTVQLDNGGVAFLYAPFAPRQLTHVASERSRDRSARYGARR